MAAFEDPLRELKLANRKDPIVGWVARIIIECAECGMRDAAEMRDCAPEPSVMAAVNRFWH